MTFQLSTQNVYQYLKDQGLQPKFELTLNKIEVKDAKNFNLLLRFSESCQWLVKQERFNAEGQMAGEFATEYRSQALIREFPELNRLQSILPEILHFDAENSVLVGNYLTEYQDVMEFYGREKCFPESIAAEIGAAIAQIHRATFQQQKYQAFLKPLTSNLPQPSEFDLSLGLDRIGPEIFGQIPADGLKFYALYQRYESLGQAISDLLRSIQPCCLTHNDLKLNNILVHQQLVEQNALPTQSAPIRLIDWERNSWGDPAFDLGTVIASYLQIWLSSLIISPEMSFEESLRMAVVPLDQLQPSMVAFIRAYHQNFPTLWNTMPNLLERTVQFAGLILIQQIQAMLQYQKSFGNSGICMLQVAKSLLCRPDRSLTTVFGLGEAELLNTAPLRQPIAVAH